MPDVFSSAGRTQAQPLEIVVREATVALARAGIEDARREARWLVGAALSLPSECFLTDPDMAVPAVKLERVADWVSRRSAREPLWRIVGERLFYGRSFMLSPATLEPRPDSETLIDAVIELARSRYPQDRPLRVLDVGTGTGCLLITVLAELPNSTGMGTDISRQALMTAEENAARHRVAQRSSWKQARSLEITGETFDILISNPPYIPSEEIASLQPEVRLYDPIEALDGGADGLQIYREIAAGAARVAPGGIWACEVGAGQHSLVAEILASGCADHTTFEIKYFHDLSGHVRCVALLAH